MRPTNRKKRRKAVRRCKKFGDVMLIKLDKCSPSWRKMLTRQKRWRLSVEPTKYAIHLEQINNYLSKLQAALCEDIGIKGI